MNLYEQPELRALTGATLRPGGLELTRRMVRLAAWRPGDRVLDLGCGPGESLGFLRGLDLDALGLDSSAALLSEAAASGPVIQGDALCLPFPVSSFQGILAECLLSLLSDKSAALREIRRVLGAGGKLCLSDLYLLENRETACDRITAGPGCQNQPEPNLRGQEQPKLRSCIAGAMPLPELIALLEKNGFKILHIADETRSLKELAVKMIFKHGSTENFFRQWGDSINCCSGTKTKIGYVVIVAGVS